MGLALLIACLLLAGVFGVAGVGKLADRSGSQRALRDFGVSAALATPLGILLPLAELGVAAALLLPVSAWWGAVGALALLLLFVAGIAFNLAQGRAPDCHCFGQLHSTPVGWPTLIRNLGLAAVAVFLVWQGRSTAGPSAVSWLNNLAPAQRIEFLIGAIVAVLIVGESWVLVHLLQQQGRLLRRLEVLEAQFGPDGGTVGPTVGTPAPAFDMPSLNGEIVTLDALRAKDLPILLVFVDPACDPCQALLPRLAHWQRDYASQLTLALVSRGTPEANHAKISAHGVANVLLQNDHEVDDAYQVQGTPSAVLVRSDGTIGSPLVAGENKIESLVAGTTGMLGPTSLLMATPSSNNGHAATVPLSQLSAVHMLDSRQR